MKDYIKWIVLFVFGLVILITGLALSAMEPAVIGTMLLISAVTGAATEYFTRKTMDLKN